MLGIARQPISVMTAKARIAKTAAELLAREPEGIRHSALVQQVKTLLPDIPTNTIRGCVVGLVEHQPNDVFKPAKGLFQHTKFQDVGESLATDVSAPVHTREQDFYAGFAEYLTEDLEECTKCIPLGGCAFKDKWGTPDVIGIRKARESDIIRYPTEIITAEIKTDTSNLITAFGQACSYRLFSHRCYLVVPRHAGPDDLARLESLCIACGLGLILFDSHDAAHPNFSICVRALRNEPDMFYLNRNLK
jgi:hypothetical protein